MDITQQLLSLCGARAQFNVGKNLLTVWDSHGLYMTVQDPDDSWLEFIYSDVCEVRG